MTDDFSNHPTSISEVKATRSGKAQDWSPRDALIHVLRQLDSGEIKLDDVIIIAVEAFDDGDDRIVIHSNVATRTRQAGVIARAAGLIARD